jgi:thiamine pyrophosphate-dependent acetolactate synthase large subunit-like protein
MKVSDAIADILRREGVETIIGYPVNHILERGAAAGIRPIIVRQERTGLHMADAMSRVTSGRKLGVFVMQHGPGTENAYGGVAQAWSESVPILVMPGGYARRLAWVERNYNSSVQMRGITKSAEPVTSGKELSAIMRRAFTRLRSGRGGPVLVEVPNDVWNEEADPSDYVVSRPLRTGPDPDAIREAAKMLLAAKRPVLYAGQGVHWAEAWSELKAARRAARHSGHHQPAGQERVSRDASALARLGRPRDPGAGASFPERGRSHPRHRLLVHADELRRHDAGRQDHHPRDARSDRREQGRRLRARGARRREAHAHRADRGRSRTQKSPRDPSPSRRRSRTATTPGSPNGCRS